MTVLIVIVTAFLTLEAANVAALYFQTGSDKFNALGVFKAWERSKADPEVHDLVRYLAYWVAGTKLIFILMLVAILVVGNDLTRVVAVGALVLAIASFYWRLAPLARQIDRRSQMTSPGYSRVLAVMVSAFAVALLIGLGVAAAGL